MLRTLNLGLAFLLELCMLAALAFWGFQASDSLPIKIILGVGAPLLAAVIWGIWMAPRSAKRLAGSSYLLLKLVLFGAAALGLAVAGQNLLAVIFAVASIVNQILAIVWKQDASPQTGI